MRRLVIGSTSANTTSAPTYLAALAVALGSWISGYFIIVHNAFMQHPVGYGIHVDGSLGIESLSAYLLNRWAWIQFAHNQMAALVTGSFVVITVVLFFAKFAIYEFLIFRERRHTRGAEGDAQLERSRFRLSSRRNVNKIARANRMP